MRPIRLEISGLHSFRDTQIIEFDKLLDTGVFGIFGSTGSGKSTILDAITLALYGTVERAANHTQGILNHGEERLTVKFSFSLGSGGKMKVYRAERSYRRSGDKSVSSAACRLVVKSDGTEKVLVSKEKEMTKAVAELLGLNVDDFTRAVVLPQGKFAEFLTIKPRDRREMLERLFALEAYGKGLTKKLSDHQHRAEFDLNGIEQRQLGLGDASPKRLTKAEAELQEARIQAAAAEKELTLLRAGQEEAKIIWAFQEELGVVKNQEQELAAERGAVEILEERLRFAERAESVRPWIQALKFAKENHEHALAEGKRLTEQRNQADKVRAAALIRWETARQERLRSEPELLRQIERLEQARQEERSFEDKRTELRKQQEEYRRLAVVRIELTENVDHAAKRLEEERKSAQAIKERLAAITVAPDEREKVNHAAQALKAYQMVAKQIEEDDRLYSRNLAEIQTLEQELQQRAILVQQALETLERLRIAWQNHQATPSMEGELSRRAQGLEQYRARLMNLARLEQEDMEGREVLNQELAEHTRLEAEAKRLEQDHQEALRFKEAAEGAVGEYKAALKSLEKQNLAGHLVGELKEGEPCPVCGSSQHPHPVVRLEQEQLSAVEAGLAEVERKLADVSLRLQRIATELAVAKSRMALQRESMEKHTFSLANKAQESAQQRGELPPEDQAFSVSELWARLDDAEKGLELEREALQRYNQEGVKISQDLSDAQDGLAHAKEESEQIRLKHAAAQRALEDLSSRLVDRREEMNRRREELDAARGSVKPEAIPQLQKQHALWDQEAAELNRTLSVTEGKIQSLDHEQHALREEKNARELELKELEVSGREAHKALTELEDKFKAVTGGESASHMLQEKQTLLEQVHQADEESKTTYEKAEKRKNQAEQDYAVWERELELKRQSLQESENKLKDGLTEAGFVTVAAAESALCDENERRQMAETIKRFRLDEVRVQEKQADLAAKLADRSLSAGEWLTWPIRIKEAEENQRLAVQRLGATEDVLLRLREKQAEWSALEKERKALAHRLELIRGLQSVLRGNSFVEFIAEEQLVNVAFDASERLALLTNYRYALEVDSEGGFVIRDDANGGFRRPVSSLSGGETFLTSLALALALSCQIQLHGEAPLEFFFLDEGFGTLDNSLLEVVMTTLEKLHLQNLTIGIISHVPELRSRLARRLIVEAAEPGGAGSRVRLERA